MSLDALQGRLGHRFAASALLVEALTHRTWVEEGGDGPHNERLEFLGDAVLGLVTTELLFHRFPDEREGRLSPLRSKLVNRATLAELASALELGQALRLGRGERLAGGDRKERILANAMEAVLAAMFLDSGSLEPARTLLARAFGARLDGIQDLHAATADPKSRLQEICQARWRATPSYRTLHLDGPAHERRFTVLVQVDERVRAEGEGPSKRKAQVAAALAALDQIESMPREGEA